MYTARFYALHAFHSTRYADVAFALVKRFLAGLDSAPSSGKQHAFTTNLDIFSTISIGVTRSIELPKYLIVLR